MSGNRRYTRKRSSESSTSGSRTSSCSSRRASTTETDDSVHSGGHRRHKRSSASLPVHRSPASRHLSWVLLNRAGARRDGSPGDRTTSTISLTSKGEEISVSFELVEPPGTSVLTVDWPRGSTTRRKSITGNVISAQRDVVLLAITSYDENTYPPDSVVDMFVYQASRRRQPPLLLLPSASAGGPVIYSHLMGTKGMGIMSCTSRDDDDDDSPSFVVAYLCMSSATNDARLFRSGSGQWETFKNLHVHGANGGHDLRWWSTDAVMPYGRRYLIWVDYYRGMILMDMSSQLHSSSSSSEKNHPPRLRYVPLPVDRVGDPKNIEFGGRDCPKASHRVCVTRHGVKFVSVDSQHWSNFGVGNHHVLKWSHRFRITTWSLREDDDGYTWRRDLTMHEQEFWDAFDGGVRFPFPHVQPRFPVVDVDNPDVVVFRLENWPHYCHRDKPKWMIEVDLRKKVLLAATAYSKEKGSDGLSGDAETINSARMESDFDPIPSELPRYLDGGQACKRRKQ